jgi:hypothetical protein
MNVFAIFFAEPPRICLRSAMLKAMSRPILLLAALIMLAACQPIEAAPPPLHPHVQGVDAAGQQGSSGTNVAQKKTNPTDDGQLHDAPAGAIVPRASVVEVEPGQEALAEAIVAASKPSIAECRGNSGGGTLRLRVVGNKSSAKITVDPGSTVNDATRHCVLEALSSLDVPDTLSQASPSMRPSAGFSSLIAINW